ncbi:hypothetical protein [Streptomyces prunicolor]|uniref:hypothetical protein n=1 Tax=Streptomyces prunicolor TaxID=67348 RepID=UPI001FDF2201|nr:hypothetical protein [Streptomyces prunicolor]
MTNLIDNLKLQVQTAKPDIFVLTTSTLGAYKLGGAAEADNYEPNTEWLDILGDTTSVSIERGSKRGDSIDTEVEVGTLEAHIFDGNVDPNTNPYIKMGVPMRLQALVDAEWVTQYTGTISRVTVSYDAEKKSHVTLYAVDRVKDLANINRAGVVAGTFAERVEDLLTKHGIDFTVEGGTSSLADNNYESTLVNHLMLAQNTELGSVFVDKSNVVKAYGNGSLPTSEPVINFYDAEVDDDPLAAYYLIDGFGVAYDDSIMVNDIFVRNLTRGVDEDLNYTSVETVYGPFANNTSVATWGARQTELTTNFATEGDVEDYAAVVLDEFDAPELRVDTIRWNATFSVDQVAGLELFDMVNIQYSSEAVTINKPFRVMAIKHDITPDAWLVTLDLLDVN